MFGEQTRDRAHGLLVWIFRIGNQRFATRYGAAPHV